MSEARFLIGDVFDRLAELPDASVDLVLTSPPFLALRSYLPADHPDKGREIGSEPTPAEFLDTLLRLSAEWRRVLAPHGSICVELGDTYSGSGGAGGDYAEGGWREGQGTFRAKGRSSESRWSHTDAHWLAALLDAEGSIHVAVDDRDANRRLTPVIAIGMNGRAMLDRAAAITGVGTITESSRGFKWQASAQQARYVLLNIWPHLMVKQEQAKAAIELARHIEEEAFGRGRPVTEAALAYREQIREFIMNLNEKGGNHGRFPNDWQPPTPPRLPHVHYAGTDWPMDKSLAGIPHLYHLSLAYGRNLLTGEPSPAGEWRVRNVVAWCRPNPPVGALGDKFRPATSYMTIATVARDRYFDLDAVRTAHSRPHFGNTTSDKSKRLTGSRADDGKQYYTDSHPAGAPPLDWWEIPTQPYKGSHYAAWPTDLLHKPIEAMCPRRVCTSCGTPSKRTVATEGHGSRVHAAADAERDDRRDWNRSRPTTTTTTTTGWTTCGCPGTDGIRLDGYHTGTGWRPGIVLDPFAGSGTTLAVATGHGRDCIGIDLDPRNVALASDRVGMFLTVEMPDEARSEGNRSDDPLLAEGREGAA